MKSTSMSMHAATATLVLAATLSLSACAEQASAPVVVPATEVSNVTTRHVATETTAAAEPAQALPLVVVHKSASCGCCGLWVDHMHAAGFQVEVRDEDNINPIKERLGVPYGKGSCHTAEVGGYFVEGHVPASDVKRLLVEKPDAKGLVLPGMPMGSPGMEMPDGRSEAYTVELVHGDGTTAAFANH